MEFLRNFVDGDVYRALLLAARASPLNATQARLQGLCRGCRVWGRDEVHEELCC